MNFITRTKNIVFYRHKLRISEFNFSAQIHCIQNLCCVPANDLKSYPLPPESERSQPDKSENIRTNHAKYDFFGTLNKPLESYKSVKRPKFKKRVIKIQSSKKDESDIFGNLSKITPIWHSNVYEESKKDNDLSDDSVMIKNISKRFRSPERYLEEMKMLVKEKKIKEALDLFVDMRRNFVTPIPPHYTFMISACGKVGYTEMAFKLYRQMTDRAFNVTSAVLTGLFNACAESPFPEYGLKKARLLKEKVEAKSYPLNQITYHAMIKAFGRCGDLRTAFEIVDDMAKADIKIDVITYSFLLMSCIENKETGFTYAVEVLRKMRIKKCSPNIFTCNLLLQATRDCDIGPEEISCLLLQHWTSYPKRPYGFTTKESLSKPPILRLESGEENISDFSDDSKAVDGQDIEVIAGNTMADKAFPTTDDSESELENIKRANIAIKNSEIPSSNLLQIRPIDGPEILELVNIKTSSDRLNLIGGLDGFLEFMRNSKVKPNIKTLTLLLECLPSNIEAEEKLLTLLDKHRVMPDIVFFNMLIRRRNFRKETEAARNVLGLANKYGLSPDIITFGVLSLGCKSMRQATVLIDDMKNLGTSPNIEIVGTMLKTATLSLDFAYMKYVMKVMEEQDIKPNEKALLDVEEALTDAKKNIIDMEQGKEVNKFYQREHLSSNYQEFVKFYEKWLKRVQLDSQKHPWLQYKTDIIDRAKAEQIE